MRWALSCAAVLGSYNPYTFSYYRWVTEVDGFASLKMFVGLVLLVLHLVCLVASVRSLGLVGVGLMTALLGSGAWVLADNSLLNIEDPSVFGLTLLTLLSTVYGFGISWSHIRNRLSGQVDSNDITQTSSI
nr:DUF6524 family protein [Azospirillum sp. SYSU D00513]